MAMPKSITTINRDGTIKFTNNASMYGHKLDVLIRAANRDIGKLILTETRKKLRKRTGLGKKALQYWNRKDGVLYIGYKKRVPGFYISYFEIKTKNHKGTSYQEAPLLLTVEQNINNINKIAFNYLLGHINKPLNANITPGGSELSNE